MFNLLIVDDEELELEGIRFLIERMRLPFITSVARNGKEALQVIQNNLPDIVLTDIKMPFMDGLELCAWIKERHRNLPVIILSAYGDVPYLQRAIHLKADEYLLKPVIEEDFQHTMEEYVKQLEAEKKENNHLTKNIDLQQDNLVKSERVAILSALSFIQKNYKKDISVASVAEHCHLSAGYLGVQFKKITGKSVLQYLTICRMEKAKELLIETNLRIADVGKEVGFESSSYFCLTFRKFFGMTAMDMREKYGKFNDFEKD